MLGKAATHQEILNKPCALISSVACPPCLLIHVPILRGSVPAAGDAAFGHYRRSRRRSFCNCAAPVGKQRLMSSQAGQGVISNLGDDNKELFRMLGCRITVFLTFHHPEV